MSPIMYVGAWLKNIRLEDLYMVAFFTLMEGVGLEER